jgi:3-oxoacyl-[acyl-carrier-protein] synthase-3
MVNSIIAATGSYIPPTTIPGEHFLGNEFYGNDGNKLERSIPDIIKKLHEITGIRERRYVTDDLVTSDIAYLAAKEALDGIDKESLDYIIVGQNLGDVKADNIRVDMVPNIAARVKHKLRIKNPYTVAFDIPFGCPGWLQSIITADYLIKSGDAKRVLVIGAETLSRVCDPHDMDSMIYADGAGATLLEATDQEVGILSHLTRSDTYDKAWCLWLGKSYKPEKTGNALYIKMKGHDLYKYALKRLFKLYDIKEIPADIMPMTISWLGNSSVATLPTLLDLIYKGKLENHRLHSGDIALFASVGAGMNINSMIYRVP